MPSAATRRGFTLIELSIVLVIIGLLIGGALTGREMIRVAELRKVVDEHRSFTLATAAFIAKYGCKPGDCPNAHRFFGPACGDDSTDADTGCNGNGNGTNFYMDSELVDFPVNGNLMVGENLKFWMHLSQAGLIRGGYTGRTDPDYPASGYGVPLASYNIPKSRYSTLVWNADRDSSFDPTGNYSYNRGRDVFMLASTEGYTPDWSTAQNAPYINGVNLSRSAAFWLDSKIDDGMPRSGAVLGIDYNSDGDDLDPIYGYSGTCITFDGRYGIDDGVTRDCALWMLR